jgi:hypothetical protein
MTALLLAGKGRVVAGKRATRSTVKVPFPSRLNVVYYKSKTQTHRSVKCNSSASSFHIIIPNTWRPTCLQHCHLVTN